MGLGVTMMFYLLFGTGVATAVFLSSTRIGPGERTFRTVSAALFWPLFLPMLLTRETTPEVVIATPEPSPSDAMSAAIAQVESELEAALSSLDGWAEGVLAREAEGIRELRSLWTAQAGRIREMDHLLVQTEAEEPSVEEPEPLDPNDRRRQSEEARRTNLRRLRAVRAQAFDDFMGTLAWVRELVSMIHLAKFTGAPASRAEELVAQIAAAVEGVSAVTWQDASAVASSASRGTTGTAR